MLGKSGWKWLMYSDSSWWLIGKHSRSKDAREAADEYEKEIFPAMGVLIILIFLGLIVFGLLKLFGAI